MFRLIGRPGRLLLPVALGLCALLGLGGRAANLAIAIILARFCSLCAGAALRAASAEVVNDARLNSNFYLSLLMGVVGGGIAAALCTIPGSPLYGYISAGTAMAGGLISLAQIASDGIYIIPDAQSGFLCDVLTAALVVVALLISGVTGWLLVLTSGLCAAVCLILGLGLRRRASFLPGFLVLKHVPTSLIRCVAPVALVVPLITDPLNAFMYCFCWGVFDALESPIRRSEEESHWLNIAVVLYGCGIIACSLLLDSTRVAHGALGALIICAALMLFCTTIFTRTLIMAVSLVLALDGVSIYVLDVWEEIPQPILLIVVLALTAASLIALIPDIKTAAVQLHGLHIARKRKS